MTGWTPFRDRAPRAARRVAGAAPRRIGGRRPGEPGGEPAGTSAESAARLSPAVSRMILTAQEDLRRDIARAMHDGPAQSLTNIVLQAQIVERLIASDPAAARPETRELIAMVQSTLDATKSFIFDVRPMVLDDLGLVPTLRRSARDRGRRAGIPVDFDSMGTRSAPADGARVGRLPDGRGVAGRRTSPVDPSGSSCGSTGRRAPSRRWSDPCARRPTVEPARRGPGRRRRRAVAAASAGDRSPSRRSRRRSLR